MMALPRIFACLLILAAIVLTANPARAGQEFADVMRYVYVPLRDSTTIAVIDSRDDTVAGSLDAGLVVRQLDASGDLTKLVAIDGRTKRVSVIELASGGHTLMDLDFVPARLLVSGDGMTAAAWEASGTVMFIDLRGARTLRRAQDLPPLRDLLFSADGTVLYVAAEGREALGIVDVASGRLIGEIAAAHPGLGGIANLTRAPSGRVAFAKAAGMSAITAVNLSAGGAGTVLRTSSGVTKAYTSATGITVILPDSAERTVSFLSASALGKTKAVLKGAAGMTYVYSGWFDTVAFIPSTAERSVLVYDQQALERGDDIVLEGVPGRGTVTPDGRKLYLPLENSDRMAVIDAEYRRQSGIIRLPGTAHTALMARTFGICH